MCLKSVFLLCLCVPSLFAQLGDKKGERQSPLPERLKAPPSPVLSPAEALNSLQAADGFKVELVASEPLVQDPVALTFDPDGRIWVVEMRGFMPTIDGGGETAPIGRISILEDTDGDGRVDRSSVFLDQLVMPRALALVQGGALVVASSKLWFAPDADGDGKADKLVCIDPEYCVGRNPEHQANGLLRALDNWIYNAKSQYRYRQIAGAWVKQRTEFRGQWGISHDNYGRLFYNVNDSQLRGDIAPPGYISRNTNHPAGNGINLAVSTNQHIFPIRMNTGVNRGYRPGVLDEQGRLREFTSACAPLIYRGDNFPPEFQGNAFVCEPAANLIKRNLVFDHGLALTSRQAYEDSEFLASTDERFRPVNACTAPDGALYVVDMYRGILQHHDYITTHLRREILQRGLDKGIHLGRIYRIVQAGTKSGPPPRLTQATPAKLIEYLSHSNGWWRDTAQRLLVERGDQSVTPALVRLALHGTNELGRIHALWTLEGLGVKEIEPLLEALNDPRPKVQVAAVRMLESLSAGDRQRQAQLLPRLGRLAFSGCPEVEFQVALSLGNFPKPDALPLLADIISRDVGQSLVRDAVLSGLQNWELRFLQLLWEDSRWTVNQPPRALVLQALASAVVKERNVDNVEVLLGLAGSRDGGTDWRAQALLAGITVNANNQWLEPIRLKSKPSLLASLSKSSVGAIRGEAENIESLFAWPGHEPPRATIQRVAPLNEQERKLFALGKEQYLAVCYGCHGVDGEGVMPLAPPLVNSSWVLGPERRLARIVLHGLEGPVHVNGTKYEPPLALPAMPALEALDDEKTAAVLTYIRREWGHSAKPIKPALISTIRREFAQRRSPWTESELLQIK